MLTITKEILLNAVDYIPVEEKQNWADRVAGVAVVAIDLSGKRDNDSMRLPVPPRYEENSIARSFALAQALAQKYLKLYPEDKVLQVSDYDEILGSHLLNQIEKMKGDKEARDKAFNVLYDFGELKKALNTSIYSRLGHLNDPLSRLLVALQAFDPNELAETVGELNEMKIAINDYQKKKKRAGRIAGDTAKAAKAEEKAEDAKGEAAK